MGTADFTAPQQARRPREASRLEWYIAGAVMIAQSGAIVPLAFIGQDGDLSEAARGTLRLFTLASYMVSGVLLLRYTASCGLVARRNLPLLLLTLLTFVSVLWSVGPSISLRRAIGLSGSLLISAFLTLRFSPREFRQLVAAMLGFLMAASLALMIVAPQLAYMPAEPVLRGVFLSKNSLGWAAGIGVTIALISVMENPRDGGNWLLAVISLACLLLSGSMTGTVSLGVAGILVAFFGLLMRLNGLSRSFLVLAFLECVALALLLLSIFLVPALEALGKDATLTGRIPLWALVDQAIAQSPLLGFGYDAFWTEGNDLVWGIWSEIQWNAPHSHMGYREVYLGMGIPGAILMLVVLGRALGQGVALLIAEPDAGWLWPNVMLGMFLIMNITESLFLSAGDMPWTLTTTVIMMFAVHCQRVEF